VLNTYIAETQNHLNDSKGQFFSIPTLTTYVNRARRRIAYASGALRVLVRARTLPNQEEYKFTDWTAICQEVPGVKEILAVRSLAIAIGPGDGAWKPMWNRLVFSDFQARFRIWNRAWVGTISYPGFYAQYGFGTGGSIFLAPIPSQVQPMELDCSCTPFPLENDDDPEPLPDPWTDAVSFYSAWLCLIQQQRREDATALLQMFQAELPFCASVVAPSMVQSPYGAVVRAV
jgi:hypothetical protein